jgi:hypothetical protein
VRHRLALPAATGSETATPPALLAALPASLDAAARDEIQRSLALLTPRICERFAEEARGTDAGCAAEAWERLRAPAALWAELLA